MNMGFMDSLRTEADAETKQFFQKVYAIMAAGLIVSGITAFSVASSEAALMIILGTPLFYVLLAAELLLVIGLIWVVEDVSAPTAVGLFVLYSFLTGLTLSVIFLVYTLDSIVMVFGITAVMFATMSIYGFVTDADLTHWGSILMMALLGMIAAMVANFFIGSTMLDLIISLVGVVVFTLLTAYDTQKIKRRNVRGNAGTPADTKEAVMGALELYLDFVNLFLHLLRLLGKRR